MSGPKPEPEASGGGDRKPKAPEPKEDFALGRWLRISFFTGVVVATPITVTAWLIYTFVGFVDRTVKPLIPPIYNPETYLPFAIPGLGLVFAIILLTMLGALAANILGRTMLGAGERLVARLPLVRNIYGALKQIVETIAASRETSFKEVVLVEYPRPGLWTMGFITAEAKGAVVEALSDAAPIGAQDEWLTVFVPTVPNPTSGFMLFAPRSTLRPLPYTVEEAAKLIVSAGIVTPEASAKNGSAGAKPTHGAVAVEEMKKDA